MAFDFPPDPRPPVAKLLSLGAHEMRTPISVVAGYLKMLLGERGLSLTPDQRKLVELADRSARRVMELTNELSELARLESAQAPFNRGHVAIGALLAEVARSHGDPDRHVTVELIGSLDQVVVFADAHRLRLAFEAIVDAVVREAARDERVIVDCQVRPRGDGPPPAPAGDGRGVFVQAVEARHGATLFGPPSHAVAPFDEWRGGLGLRLPIARRVIEAEGGEVWSPLDRERASGIALVLPVHG